MIFFETARLIARRFDPRDLDDFAAMRADPEVARYQSWDSFTRGEAREFLDWVSKRDPGEAGWFQFALEDRSGAFIGDCGLRVMEHDRRLGQIGYTVARRHWDRGYGTEAVTALTAYAFASFPLHRLTASIDPRNPASARVLEKAGYEKEAHFRQSEWFKGAWADDVIYARLRPPCPAA